mmetsp:Transcript_19128/g.61534  ORF Transcript_19128/g.61534 Transcript_19128/m.61534 type:complete len:243 (-) Transcript_19128:2508-3236(-)
MNRYPFIVLIFSIRVDLADVDVLFPPALQDGGPEDNHLSLLQGFLRRWWNTKIHRSRLANANKVPDGFVPIAGRRISEFSNLVDRRIHLLDDLVRSPPREVELVLGLGQPGQNLFADLVFDVELVLVVLDQLLPLSLQVGLSHQFLELSKLLVPLVDVLRHKSIRNGNVRDARPVARFQGVATMPKHERTDLRSRDLHPVVHVLDVRNKFRPVHGRILRLIDHRLQHGLNKSIHALDWILLR